MAWYDEQYWTDPQQAQNGMLQRMAFGQPQQDVASWVRVPGRALRAAATGVPGILDSLATPAREGMNAVNYAFGGSPN
jgi:hypothetical protein